MEKVVPETAQSTGRAGEFEVVRNPSGSHPAVLALGLVVLAALTAIGGYLRFYDLGLKPLHHDEGVNGWFVMRLLDEGVYRYNPRNYHGPLLYFLATPVVALGGRTVEALRFMTSLFGTLAIPAMLLLRHQLGWFGVLLAAGFIAVAPVEVYFSRTAIHEIYNFTFNGVLVGAAAWWLATERRWALVLAAVSLVCLFATKETTVLTVAALMPAVLVAVALGKGPLPTPGMAVYREGLVGQLLAPGWYVSALALLHRPALRRALLVALIVWVVLFTFWLNPIGVGAFFEAFFRWGDTGTDGKGHQKIWTYFFTHLIWPYYRPVIFLGGLGLLWGSLRRDRLALFTLTWFALAAAAYAVIPYKTPWCVISFTTPLFIGVGLTGKLSLEALLRGPLPLRLAGALLIPLSLAWWVPYSIPMPERYDTLVAPLSKPWHEDLTSAVARTLLPPQDTWTINFDEYDVKGHPFIYVQNVREYLGMIRDLEGLMFTAQRNGDPKKVPSLMMIDAKNPTRWYLRKTGDQKWPRKFEDGQKKQVEEGLDILCVSKEEVKKVEEVIAADRYVHRRYHERPGRIIDMWVRKELWQEYVGLSQQNPAVPPPAPDFEAKSFSDLRTRDMKDPWSKKAMN